MNQVIIAGLAGSDRADLLAIVEDAGYEAVTMPTIDRLRAGIETHPCSVLFLDTALDGAGGVDLLATLPLNAEQCVVLVVRDAAGKALADSLRSDTILSIDMPFDKDAIRHLLEDIGGAGVQADATDESKQAGFESMLGGCPKMLEVYEMIAKVAPTDASVLICGESGTGKELVASAIHRRSPRSGKPFVAVNCGAIAENLIESELFGHEKGAFTGASKPHSGVFEQADGGTLFLDEVTEMPEPMQVRLLRVLESGQVRRVGSEREMTVDVRVIAATNRNPQEAIEQGRFRSDVMFRLAVFPLTLPKLCERGDDIVLMANHFLSQHNQEAGTDKRFSKKGMQRLLAYDWPGNVRQLRNIVQRAYILESATIDVDCLQDLLDGVDENTCDAAVNAGDSGECDACDDAATPKKTEPDVPSDPDDGESAASVSVMVGSSIDEGERALILKTLKELDGDKKRSAKVLGISLKTLYNRLNEYEAEDEAGDDSEVGEPVAG